MSDTPLLQQKSETRTEKGAEDQTGSKEAGFVWGLASAAQQTESRWGRGRSNWDEFSDTPGKIKDGSTTERLTEFDTRYTEDLDIMAAAGIPTFRLSIAWPRIQPNGPGKPSENGLDHYARLFDAMQERGIEPWVTLFHWDTPVWAGDFLDRDMAQRLADYAEIVVERFADRITHWMVVNEPNTVAVRGYGAGIDAPGYASTPKMLKAIHHLNLSIGLMTRATRLHMSAGSIVGTVHNCAPVRPANNNIVNRAAAAIMDNVWNWNFLDPLFGRGYPTWFRPLMAPFVKDGDMNIIATELDFLGVNYYSGLYFKMTLKPPFVELGGWPEDMEKSGYFPVDPQGFEEILLNLKERYSVPIYITETGFSLEGEADWDWTSRISDAKRTENLDKYMEAISRARSQGADVRGLFYWGATDNWEWADGFTIKLGMIAVDMQTQKRQAKNSLFKLGNQIAKYYPDKSRGVFRGYGA